MKKLVFAGVLAFFAAFSAAAQSAQPSPEVLQLLSKHTCFTCHKVSERSVGPAYMEIAKKGYTKKQIVNFIYKPVPSNWPDYPPMIGLPQVPKGDANKIAAWIESIGKK